MYQIFETPSHPVVHSIWVADSVRADTAYTVAPEPGVNLVMKLYPEQIEVVVSGAVTRQQSYPYIPDVRYLGVRFQPGYIYPDNVASLSDLRDTSMFLSPALFSHLPERLYEQETLPAQLPLLYESILKSTANAILLPVTMREALHHIGHWQGRLSVYELSRMMMLSERQLERLFKTHLGLSPKLFCNTVRIRHVLEVLWQASEKPLLTNLALQSGYSDQAHLANHFRKVIGISPSEYMREQALYT